jgi:hypothetical protein
MAAAQAARSATLWDFDVIYFLCLIIYEIKKIQKKKS